MKNSNDIKINKNYGTVNDNVNVNVYNYYESEWNNIAIGSHYKLPFRYRLFTGRSKELSILESVLNDYQLAILSGIAGIGKSQIAKEFTLSRVDQYELILWINAVDEVELQSEFRQIAMFYSLCPNVNEVDINLIIEMVKKYICDMKSSLIIIDGLDDLSPSKLKKYLPASNSKIIISTQNATYDEDEFEIIYVQDFINEDAENLILNNTKKRLINSTDTDDVARLVDSLYYYPLAIEHARAYINKNKISIHEYCDLFGKEDISMFSNRLSDYERTALTTFKISFDKAVETTKEAYEILGYSSLMNLNEIPYAILLRDTYIENSVFREALDALTNYSLINVNGKYLSIHGIVQYNMQNRLRKDECFVVYAKELCDRLENKLPKVITDEEERDLAKELIPHISYLTKISVNLKELEEKTLDLSLDLGKVLYEFGEFQKAIEFMKIVLNISKNSGRYVHEIDILISLGIANHYIGKPEEAFKYSFKAKELLYKRENQNTQFWWNALNASLYGNLGIMYKVKTEHIKSLECYKVALHSSEMLNNEMLIINQLVNIGVHYKNQGEYDKALEVYDRAIKVNCKNEMIKRKAYANKAVILRLTGDYKNAKIAFENEVETSRKIGDLRSECISLFNLGMCLYGLEEGNEALKIFGDAYNISDKIDLLTSKADILTWIGLTHRRFSGNIELANEYYSKAYDIALKTKNYSIINYIQSINKN